MKIFNRLLIFTALTLCAASDWLCVQHILGTNSAFADNQTEDNPIETVAAQSVFSISNSLTSKVVSRSPFLVSRRNIVYLKFDLSTVNATFAGAKLNIPIRSKSSGPIVIRQSSTKWSDKLVGWNSKPRLFGSKIGSFIVSPLQRDISISLDNSVTSAGIYSFAVLGKRNARVLILSNRGNATPKIHLNPRKPTVTPGSSPTVTPMPTPIARIFGVNISRGPYLQRGAPESIVVRWRTDVLTNSAVYYGTSINSLSASTTDLSQTTEHRLTLPGLIPNTTYFYRVGTTAGAIHEADAEQFFVTSPLSGTNKATRIWVVGDSGTANLDAQNVRNAYRTFTGSRKTDLWLMLGDNAYESGTQAEYQAGVFDTYPTFLKNTVLWPTLGNHDAISADSGTLTGVYYDIFSLPRNAESGGTASGTEAYYSFDYGQIHFVCLDSMDSSRAVNQPMMTWLQSDLDAATLSGLTRWTIVFFHHPPYTKGSHDSDVEVESVQMRQNFLPVLEDYGVDLVLTGHSHSYERSFLIDKHYGLSSTFSSTHKKSLSGGSLASGGIYNKTLFATHAGTIYAVAGSSGKLSGGPLNHPAMYTSQASLGSMVLDIDGNTLDARFISDSGTQSDIFTIQKTP